MFTIWQVGGIVVSPGGRAWLNGDHSYLHVAFQKQQSSAFSTQCLQQNHLFAHYLSPSKVQSGAFPCLGQGGWNANQVQVHFRPGFPPTFLTSPASLFSRALPKRGHSYASTPSPSPLRNWGPRGSIARTLNLYVAVEPPRRSHKLIVGIFVGLG